MVPAQKQTQRPVEQNRRHTTIPTSLLKKVPKIYDGERTASSTNVVGESGYLSTRN
jgi:hypothetical protein